MSENLNKKNCKAGLKQKRGKENTLRHRYMLRCYQMHQTTKSGGQNYLNTCPLHHTLKIC